MSTQYFLEHAPIDSYEGSPVDSTSSTGENRHVREIPLDLCVARMFRQQFSLLSRQCNGFIHAKLIELHGG